MRGPRRNDHAVVRADDAALLPELHPDLSFEHHYALFHLVHVEWHCSTRLGPVHEQADPARAKVLVREKPSVDAGRIRTSGIVRPSMKGTASFTWRSRERQGPAIRR